MALGVLPVLVSAAERYDDCVRSFKRYKNFAKVADRYQSHVAVQKAIFKNQCRILLEQIIDHDAASSMLNNGTKHPKWSDPELEKQLCEILRESRDACMTTVETIEEHLRDVESEGRHLESTIEQDARVC